MRRQASLAHPPGASNPRLDDGEGRTKGRRTYWKAAASTASGGKLFHRGRYFERRYFLSNLPTLTFVYLPLVALIFLIPLSNLHRVLFCSAMLAPYFVNADVNGTGGIFRSRILAVLWLNLAYVVASLLWCGTGLFEVDLRHLASIAILLAATTFLASQGETSRDRLFFWIGWAATTNAAISFWMFFSGTGAEQNTRLLSWLWPDPNSAAAVFSIAALGLVLQTLRHSGVERLLFATPAVVCLAFISLASSRTAMVGLLAGLAIIAASNVRRVSRPLVIVCALVVGGMAAYILTSRRWSITTLFQSLGGCTDV